MIAKYKILKDQNLLVQKYEGSFCFDDLFEHINNVASDPAWQEVDKIITDLRGVDLEIFYKEMEKFLNFRKTNIAKPYVNVFIVDTPLATAVVHLYKSKLNSEKNQYEYCSTVEYAVYYLGLSKEEGMIYRELEKLQERSYS